MVAKARIALYLLALVVVVVAAPACETSEDASGASDAEVAGGASEDARRDLLVSVSRNVIQPRLRTFAMDAEALEDATEALAEAPDDEDLQGAARDAFAVAMQTWQGLEMLQVGPAGVADMTMGGQGFREQIYSWPDKVGPCRVDQQLVAKAYEEADFFSDTALVNDYGLDALEYLLHADRDGHACAITNAINSDPLWGDADEIRRRRARYGAAVAEEVATRARELRDAWGADEGDFVSGFEAGEEPYGSRQDVLDGLYAAMLYLDQEVKDQKLAIPAGISPDCASNTCPDRRESPWADASLAHVRTNLAVFRALLHGGDEDDEDAFGMLELLQDVGADDLADDMEGAVDAAIDAGAAVDGTLVEALSEDLDSVQALHAAVKDVTDLLKSQFVTVLNLRVPHEGAGDND